MSWGPALILAAALVTYATRLAGLLLAARLESRGAEAGDPRGTGRLRGRTWDALDGLMGYVPVAAFAALIAPDLGLGTPEMLPRLFGATVAAAVVLRVGHLWAGLGAGMAAYWAFSALAAGLVG
jgi:branched-subunit amino acid transport protein